MCYLRGIWNGKLQYTDGKVVTLPDWLEVNTNGRCHWLSYGHATRMLMGGNFHAYVEAILSYFGHLHALGGVGGKGGER